MTNLNIGDRVTHAGRTYVIRGFSPMSVSPRRVLLEDATSRQVIEVAEAELTDEDPPTKPRRRP